jgi:hypothetical protein
MADREKLTDELAELERTLQALTVRMQQAEARQRHLLLAEPPGGAAEQRKRLAEMDRVMNRMRALEAKLAILDRGGEMPFK